MRCYFRFTPVHDEVDYVRTINMGKDELHISKEAETIKNRFNEIIANDIYYKDGKHTVRRNAVRAVEIYTEVQEVDVNAFDLDSWKRNMSTWLKGNSVGYQDDYILLEGSNIHNDCISYYIVYTPIDQLGKLNYKNCFSHRFIFLIGSLKTYLNSIYKFSFSDSSILKERKFTETISDDKRLSDKNIEIEKLKKQLRDKEKELEKVKYNNLELKEKLYDTSTENQSLKNISTMYKNLQVYSGDANRDYAGMVEMVKAMVYSKYAYKYYKSMHMEQEVKAFDNIRKYSSIYFDKNPSEKEIFKWL